MPTIGTMTEERNVTRRRKAKNTMVPRKAAMTAAVIFTRIDDSGATIITSSRPRPAHSVVPVVDGSTKRFCVSSCITRPHIAIAAPANTRAMVRGTRVMPNISAPSSAPKMS